MKTVREVAEELNISRQAVYNKLTVNFKTKFTTIKKINNKDTLVINKDGVNKLKSDIDKVDNQVDSQLDNKVDKDLTTLLSENIRILSKQLETKDIQISELNARLKEAQELNRNTQVLMKMTNEKIQMIESAENKAKKPWYKSIFGIKDDSSKK